MVVVRWSLAAFDQQLLHVSVRQPAAHHWATPQCAPMHQCAPMQQCAPMPAWPILVSRGGDRLYHGRHIRYRG